MYKHSKNAKKIDFLEISHWYSPLKKWFNFIKEQWNEEFKRKKEINCKEIAFSRDSNEFVYLSTYIKMIWLNLYDIPNTLREIKFSL